MKNTMASLLAVAALVLAPASCYPARESSNTASPPPAVVHAASTAPATSSKVPNYTFDQLYKSTTQLFDQMMYPNNVAQSQSVNSTLFAENVVGRIEQVRSFHGRQENTEWLFNIFTSNILHPDIQGLFGVPLSYKIEKFAANENIVAADIKINLNVSVIGITAPLQMATFITFDAAGAISEYDMTFRYLERNFQYLFQVAGQRSNLTAVSTGNYVTALIAESVCGVASKYCTGAHQQYDSTAACVKFLSEEVGFGGADVLGSDNLICRMMHQTLVPSRPGVYCPAIGPTGGEGCSAKLQTQYLQIVTDPLFVNYPFVPYGYAAK